MTKQQTTGSNRAVPDESFGAGAPENIVTTYAELAGAIRSAVDLAFSDPLVFGPKPLGITVDRIVAETIARVLGPDQPKEAA